MIKVYNEDCFETMKKMSAGQIDIVLTSPFYNTTGSKKTLSESNTKGYSQVRYDVYTDLMTNDDYCNFTERLFLGFDRILNANGCVLYNLSYGSKNTEGMFHAVHSIIKNTPFTIADVIAWKKAHAMPNNVSKNKLTRIWEFVFVFCRKSEFKTFNCNKKIKSFGKHGQPYYENIFNFIEAKNNDGVCPYNKATFSSELCEKLLKMYAVSADTWVYDPFMGSGTTAVACKNLGFNCIGSEISENQVKWANERLEGVI